MSHSNQLKQNYAINGPNRFLKSSVLRQRSEDVEAGRHHSMESHSLEYSESPRYDGESTSQFLNYVSSNTDASRILLSPSSPQGRFERDIPGQPIRKKSLVRPERNRIDKDHRNYHYHKHAAHMHVHPSSTGNDPILADSGNLAKISGYNIDGNAPNPSRRLTTRDRGKRPTTTHNNVPPRHGTSREMKTKEGRDYKQVQKSLRPPTIWNLYCAIITLWAPGFIMKRFGMPTRAQQRAWREKIGLISIIISIMAFVGFITFGFTAVVCRTPPERLRVNQVGSNYMIFHGLAYDLSTSHHPAAQGIPLRDDGLGANILYDLPKKHGGQDGSFLFQNVNGRCKGVITLAEDSDVPTNDNGDLAWYFPCATFNQDGSTDPNLTVPYYLGYGCHTTSDSRDAFYLDLRDSADVYFTWNDIKNGSRNLVVYSGSVLDLDLLRWFNKSQVQVPDRFQELSDHDSRVNQAVRGRDITRMFQAQLDKKHALCLEEIIKVGSIDADTVGCIASQIVLYISLILILAIVLVRFALAVIFQWFICGKYSPAKAYSSSDQGNRNRQIEEWSDDIYRLPAILPENPGRAVDGSGRKPIRTSFLPTTSRYSSTTEIERPSGHRRPMTTMSTQHLSRQPVQPHSGQKQDNHADGVLESGLPVSNTSYTTAPGPADPTHDAIIPQPPPDWMPFGFPLAHVMCLVTAYSEGGEAIRTTLDSIAITDYPNSHKVIVVICDGMIKGKGEMTSTPDACLGMIKDNTVTSEMVQPLSYVAVASGAKRHNMAKVYCGFYDYGTESHIPTSQQQQVPIMLIVKCGTPDEIGEAKPGNRGKRDSQIILMSFLQKVMFDERMTELEYEMFTGLRRVTGILPEFYEITLMVDADTKVFTDSLSHMVSAMVKDPRIMGLCGETKIANKRDSWVTAIQVFEYFVSHHLSKSFESMFGGVTCLPGCFCMYRIKAPKGTSNYWVPILANPDIVEHYSENMVETLHEKNLYLLGEDRYLTTLMLRTFPKRQQVFIPQAVCKTTVPDKFIVLLSQRRRWINSTIHNLMELVLVRDLCGTFCFSMQFIVSVELAATLVLPAAIAFTFYVGKFTAYPFPQHLQVSNTTIVIDSIVNPPAQIVP